MHSIAHNATVATERLGATLDEWAHFISLGLTEHLLPAVANKAAPIQPGSKLKRASLGKVPSRYNTERQAVGFGAWTEHQSTPREVASWRLEPDYALSIQARAVRAIDVDIEDATLAGQVLATIEEHVTLPVRRRPNSAKFLAAFRLAGAHPKRKITTAAGIIEFLGDGQQWVAAGTHPSGVRYVFPAGPPAQFPELTPEQFEALFAQLQERFGTAPASAQVSQLRTRGAHLQIADPFADYLAAKGLALGEHQDGAVLVECPWSDQHSSGETGDSSTAYFPAGTNGYAHGAFRCLHAHCEDKGLHDFQQATGYQEDISAEFEDLEAQEREAARNELAIFELLGEPPERAQELASKLAAEEAKEFLTRLGIAPRRPPFASDSIADLRSMPRLKWLVKHALPQAEVGMLFGPSGSGKSFAIIDMALAIARGLPSWHGRKVRQARVAYVAAEGSSGLLMRLEAYERHHGVRLDDVPFAIHWRDIPKLLKPGQAEALGKQINAEGGAGLIIVDTLAKTTPGANENASEDMSRAFEQCQLLSRLTGALVLVVHHSGKDVDRGARGWSGMKGAVDVELEVMQGAQKRSLRVSKLKDGRGDQQFGFELREVVLGLDEDGDEEASCVALPTDAVVTRGEQRMGKEQEFTLAEAVRIVRAGDPVDVLEVARRVAREMPFDEAAGKRDRRFEHTRDRLWKLIDRGLLHVGENNVLTLPNHPSP